MKAVVLGGGFGTRLRPYLSPGINKHLVPVHDRPLIHHVLHTLQRSGVRDVLVVLNGINPGLVLESIGNGSDFGLSVYYAYDTKPVGLGPANNILEAESWIGGEPFILMLGDSVYLEPLPLPEDLGEGAWTWTTRIDPSWDDFRKYAQVVVEGDLVTRLERSETPFSPLIQTGAWVFPPDVSDRVRKLFAETPEGQEVRITDVVRSYVPSGELRAIGMSPCAFIDCGTPAAIERICRRLCEAGECDPEQERLF